MYPPDRAMKTATRDAHAARRQSVRRADVAFLPAALEIMETPPSPTARATAATCVALVVGGILWASIGKVDIVTTAPGRVVATGRTKVLQPFETSVVRSIDVDNGAHVVAGQPLVVLDPTENEAEGDRAAHALMLARLDKARLLALLDGSPDAFRRPPDADDVSVGTAMRLMQALADKQSAKLDDLDHQAAEKRGELAETKAEITRVDATMPMLEAHMHIRGDALHTGAGNQIDYIDAQRMVVDQVQARQVDRVKLTEISETLASIERQRDEAVADYRSGLLGDLSKAEGTEAEKQADLIKATQHARLQTLRAPIDGTVQQLGVFTVGGVVTPAEAVVAVVPDNTTLEIEAMVPNREIGFVHPGQDAEVKVETLEFTRYGLLRGVVRSVSRDVVTPDPLRQGPTAAAKPDHSSNSNNGNNSPGSDTSPPDGDPDYAAHIQISERGLQTEEGFVPLEPGMTVTAEIRTGRRSVLDYLLSPLRRYRHDSFTER
jgi:hemolysin D